MNKGRQAPTITEPIILLESNNKAVITQGVINHDNGGGERDISGVKQTSNGE